MSMGFSRAGANPVARRQVEFVSGFMSVGVRNSELVPDSMRYGPVEDSQLSPYCPVEVFPLCRQCRDSVTEARISADTPRESTRHSHVERDGLLRKRCVKAQTKRWLGVIHAAWRETFD